MSERLKVIIEKNTFYQRAPEAEKKYQEFVDSITISLKRLREKVKHVDVNKPNYKLQLQEVLAKFLREEKDGIECILTLCGLSDEKLYRIISFLRISYHHDEYESQADWIKEEFKSEWKIDEIKKKLREDPIFTSDLVKILTGENPLVTKVLPMFDLKKLDASKFLFLDDAIFDSLARYSLFGSYSVEMGKSPENTVKNILKGMNIKYESGKVDGVRRKIDIVIPSKKKPKIFIQCSHVGTTSSGMGDKAKTEQEVGKDIKKNYPNAVFITFVDGIGWLIRSSDLERMVQAGDYVFTFHEDQLKEFKKLLPKFLSKEDYEENLWRFFQ